VNMAMSEKAIVFIDPVSGKRVTVREGK
jgi:hypothetical protein